MSETKIQGQFEASKWGGNMGEGRRAVEAVRLALLEISSLASRHCRWRLGREAWEKLWGRCGQNPQAPRHFSSQPVRGCEGLGPIPPQATHWPGRA